MRSNGLLTAHSASRRSLLAPALLLAALGAVFVWKAYSNYLTQDPVNSNFFSFWLSGHMVWTGESPYDAAQFKAGFDAYGASYRPSRILQYPLPLMYFMAPIGTLPPQQAYIVWQLISEAILAAVLLLLLRQEGCRVGLGVPVTAALLFFGPMYLTLQIGSVGAISLLAVGLALLLLKRNLSFAAGVLLSITLLKPPQAMALLLLAGFWFLARRNWRAIMGMAAGALALLAVWLLRDPQGLAKFRGSSDFLLGHSLGVQSNVYSFAFLACRQDGPCMWVLGSVLLVALLGAAAYVLWRNRATWDDWQALNLIIPVGFVCALYLWEYDQILYVIPIAWIVVQLRRRSYLAAAGFVVLADIVSLVALASTAYTHKDLLSVLTTLLVLGTTVWLLRGEQRSAGESPRA